MPVQIDNSGKADKINVLRSYIFSDAVSGTGPECPRPPLPPATTVIGLPADGGATAEALVVR